jgi:hypothetical protein
MTVMMLAVSAVCRGIGGVPTELRLIMLAADVGHAERRAWRVGAMHVHELAVFLTSLVLDQRVVVQRADVREREQPGHDSSEAPKTRGGSIVG